MKTLSQQLALELSDYYLSEGIVPNDSFACKYYQESKCPDLNNEPRLARGMQCHIGPRYGEKLKILVASLDCGYGGAMTIEERTADVVKKSNERLNPHMRGTYKALSYFLDDTDPKELVNYMVMTNTCKCCRWVSNQLDIKYYLNCGCHTVEEIIRIKPDAILFQGKNAPAYCLDNNLIHSIEELKSLESLYSFSDTLKYFEYQGFRCYAIICIHPSARGRSANKRKHFYDEELPLIAQYIKEHPLD